MAKKKARRGSSKLKALLLRAMRTLESAKKYASPTQWARIHDIEARLGTALGARRPFNRKKRPTMAQEG